MNAEAPADDAVQPEVPAQPVEEAQQNTPAPEDTEGGGEAGQQQEETPDQQQEELYPEDDGNGEESVPSVSRPDAGSAESSAAPVGTTAEPLTVSVTTAMKYAFAGENALTFETQIAGGTEPFEISCEIDRDGTPVWSSQEYQTEVTYMPEEAGGYELVLSVTDAAGQAASGRCAIPVAVRHEESPSDWEPALKEVRMTGRYAEDLLAIARTQLGYTESADNFIVTEEGARQGYTRYGQWQGDAYEPWDAAFAAFCLYYAGVRDVPADAKAEKWADELKRRGMYRDLTAENRPEEGDFLFTRDGEVTRIGLVEKTDDTGVTAIEGDVGGAVARVTYGWDDARLAGFGDPRTTLTDEAAGVTVTGIFPEGATLTVQLLAEDADGFTESQDRIHAALSPLYDRYAVNLADVTEAAVYIPSLTVNGEAVSLCKKVRVGVSACGGRFAGHGDVRVLTFSDEQTELLSAEEKDGGDGADAIVSASFRTDRLSEFALTAVAPDRLTMRRTAADGDAKVTVTYGAGAGVPESAELRVRQIRGDGDDADRAEYQKRQAEAASLLETEAGGENAASQPDTAASGSPENAENADVSRQTDQNAENAAADQQADQNAENAAADQQADQNAENAAADQQTDQNAENAAADQQTDQNAENAAAADTASTARSLRAFALFDLSFTSGTDEAAGNSGNAAADSGIAAQDGSQAAEENGNGENAADDGSAVAQGTASAEETDGPASAETGEAADVNEAAGNESSENEPDSGVSAGSKFHVEIEYKDTDFVREAETDQLTAGICVGDGSSLLDGSENRIGEDGTVKAAFSADDLTECFLARASENRVLRYRGSDYTVTVTCGADAQIPDDASLDAAEIVSGSDRYAELCARYLAALQKYQEEGRTEIPAKEMDRAADQIEQTLPGGTAGPADQPDDEASSDGTEAADVSGAVTYLFQSDGTVYRLQAGADGVSGLEMQAVQDSGAADSGADKQTAGEYAEAGTAGPALAKRAPVKQTTQESDAADSGEDSQASGGASENDQAASFPRFFDLTISSGGKEIEPAAKVQVNIAFDSMPAVEDPEDLAVIHYGSEKTDVIAGEGLGAALPGDESGSGDRGSVTFSLDSFSEVTVTTRWPQYKVTLDPNNGGVRYYNGAAIGNDYPLQYDQTQFSLPRADQVKNPTDYLVDLSIPRKGGYVLNGWYDITGKRWYQPGASVSAAELNGHTLYADWVPNTYNIGNSGNLANTVDTSSFITTRLFDYNDLYNIPHSTYNPDKTWSEASGPVFFDTAGGKQARGTLMNPNGREKKDDSSNHQAEKSTPTYGNPANGYVTPGLGTSEWLSTLFDPNNAWNTVGDTGSVSGHHTAGVLGKTYVGTGNYLYQYDANTGYYYYDSTKNAATYNRSAGRFYVYNYREGADPSKSTDKSDFLPFNTGSPGQYFSNKNKFQVNYWFGMSSEVKFFLPNKTGEQDASGHYGNQSTNGDDMVFKFSGDDDVWVLVDGKTLLDLGGVHDVVYGEIDFSKGKVTVVQGTSGDNNGQSAYLKVLDDGTLGYDHGGLIKTNNFSLSSGEHTLTLYYLERGGSQSNAAIYFNLAPRYSLTLNKRDEISNQTLQGAEFGVYTDENCSVPALLWRTDGTQTNLFTTDQNGQIQCNGLGAGRTYYLKELTPPDGYPDVSDQTIILTIDQNGTASVSTADSGGSWMVDEGNAQISSEQNAGTKGTFHLTLNVDNQKTTRVTVRKIWKDADGKTIDRSALRGYAASFELWRRTAGSLGGSSSQNTTHTVTFRTQYFGSGNGTNMDTAPISQGGTQTVTVKDGDTLPFDAAVLNSGNMGIYSVAANSVPLTGTMSDSTGNNKFQVNGNWVSLYRKGQYQLGNIRRDQTVVVTFLGYLQYDGGSPSIAKSVTVTPGKAVSGGGSGSGGSMLPAKDEKAADVNPNPVTLKDGTWSYTWENLPTADGSGQTYYYYVKEIRSTPGYTVSMDNNDGITGGTITATNTQEAVSVPVSKQWLDGDNRKKIRPNEVQIRLYRDETKTEKTVTLSAASNWQGAFNGLPKYRYTASGGTLTAEEIQYTVKEENVPDGYWSSVDGSAAGYTVTNHLTYELPNSGGPGTYLFTFSGAAALAAALLFTIKARRKEERGEP
ncbi:MAG: Cna B-type domain-containing protein [Clostridiales bacterium]|nr:Cna B-type domain-containing protein [Clostridiales bacterium]